MCLLNPGGMMTRTRLALARVLLLLPACGCKDAREFPAGFPRAFFDEAVRMTEAIVPYCDDLLTNRSCPTTDPEPWHDFRYDPIVKALPLLEHPFRDSAQIYQYRLSCGTRDGHPNHMNHCDVRVFGSGKVWPLECEDYQDCAGWRDPRDPRIGRQQNLLRRQVNPRCLQYQFRLIIRRKTPKGGMAYLFGDFKDPSVIGESPK
jgi:hypothetical protein